MLLKLLLVLLCLIIVKQVDGFNIQNLGGSQWIAWNQNKSIKVASNVPGSIYSDLERSHHINNIYVDFNDVNYRWISYDNWTFVRHFNVENDISSYKQIYLTCDGLDTIGEVWLNGILLGRTDNMFIRYRWPVKTILKSSSNVIQINFISAPVYGKQQYLDTIDKKYIIPPVCTPKVQNGECHVNFLRKMQASFSWDWGPAFPTQGIWKPIYLEAFDEIVIRSISVDTELDHTEQWLLNVTAFIDGSPKSHSTGNISLFLNGTKLAQQPYSTQLDTNGDASLNLFILIPKTLNIKKWYPNGVGEQTLYPLKVEIVSLQSEKTIDKTVKIGFRTIRLVQDRLPSSAESYSFYFEVNNLPIFAKGSNWIPAHVLYEAIDETYIRNLLLSAKLANMNMLRIWGGGIYEDDRLYEIADEYGILIWQDMMFAVALYPTDINFLSSVQKEIRQQIRRLQHHPSIALWAGNNENEAGISGFWWPQLLQHFEQYKDDYRKLYIDTIMPIVISEDPKRPFVPSSPSNGPITVRDNYISPDPSNSKYGDVHFYHVNDNVWEWWLYPSAKFVSEYGFQSWSSLHTLSQSIPEEALKYPLTESMVHREHQENGLIYLNHMMEQNLRLPSNGSIDRLEDYIYLSQIHQSMAIKIETEFYRRDRDIRNDGNGFTMGALYWQLNDIWPTVSWASVEFGGKWKMLHYFARKMFDNLLVDVWEENHQLNVAIIRDDHIDNLYDQFTVQIDIFDWSSTSPLLQHRFQRSSKPFSVTHVFRQDIHELLNSARCVDRNHCFIEVSITTNFQGNLIVKRNFLLLEPIKNAIGLKRTKIEIASIHELSKDNDQVRTFELELHSSNIAPFVWIDFKLNNLAPVGLFSDNGFFITNQTTKVLFQTKDHSTSVSNLKNLLTVRSLMDVQ